MNSKTIQRIIDHWHIGSLCGFSCDPEFFRVTTSQGVFYLIEISRKEWQSNYADDLVEKFLNDIPDSARLVRPPFAHVKGYYYGAFRYNKPHAQG